MKILYIHNADMRKKGANKIQVSEQVEALNCDLLSVKTTIKLPYFIRSLILFLSFWSQVEKWDCVYTRDLPVAYLIGTFYKKVKVIYEVHEIPDKRLWKHLYTRTYYKINRIVAISKGLKHHLPKNKKVTVLQDAVNLKNFNIKLTKKQARKILFLPNDKKIVMYVGSEIKWKGVEILKKAEKLINDEDVLFKYITNSEHNLIPVYLKAADVLILPNTSENLNSAIYTSPLKLFEYMASKRPIIASDLPSINEIVSDKEVTFFLPNDANDLANEISTYLLFPHLVFEKEKVKEAFKIAKINSWEKRAEKIKGLFNEE